MTARTAVITGSSKGLGAGMATYFHEQGLSLGLCSRSAPALPTGDRVLAERVDVTDEVAMEAFADHVIERFSQIDLWINNAGSLAPIDSLRNCSAADFRRSLDVNIMGVFLGTRAFVKHLRKTKRAGVLINISSGAATSAYEGWSAYCAGKAAVELLTACVAREEQDTGLRAYAVAPGVIDTDMQELIRQTPAKRFPMVNKFIEMKEKDTFSSTRFVASEILDIAFDPERRPSEVSLRLPPGKTPRKR